MYFVKKDIINNKVNHYLKKSTGLIYNLYNKF